MAWRPPEQLVERARQIDAGTLVAAEPGDAATVILLRMGPGGLEVHLQRRAATMVFPGVHVFPGGRVDPADFEVPLDLPAGWAQALGGTPELAAALVVAACRETFEEAGVVLAEDGVSVAAGPARSGAFSALGVTPSTRMIRPWARWITPTFEPRRFDTRFFVAALPPDQATAGDDAGGEADRALWVSPEAALKQHRAGEMAMLPPTVFMLTEISEFADPEAVLAAADGRRISAVLPVLHVNGDEVEFVIGAGPS